MPKIAESIRSFLVVCAVLAFAPPASAQLGGLLLPPPAPPPPDLSKLDPLLQSRVSLLTGRSHVIVRATSIASVAQLSSLIQLLGGTLGRQLPIVEGVVANIPNVALPVLTSSSLVRRVALDRVVRGTMERTSATIGATGVRQELGYDGSGIGVAVIDSGVTSWHDDLTQAGIPGSQRVDQFVDFVNGRTTPYDDYGHGTHVAGIISGNGFDSGGARGGIAPGVHLQVLKVLDGAGRGRISDVIAAFDYVVNHSAPVRTRIINLSVAAGVFESYDTDLLTLAAKRAADQGIVVVASAGNAGKDAHGHTKYSGVTAPGNAPWVLTVGASSTQGTIDRGDDLVAAFSSRGPTAIDRRAKPDLVAPGVGIESLSDPHSALFTSKSPYLLNGTVPTPYPPYLSLSGTSQAAPVVAGTVALMLQANPVLTSNAVKAILQYTAQDYAGYDALTQGAGFLNARGAVELARFFGQPTTIPFPSTATWSRQLIWGNHRVKGGLLAPTANAWGPVIAWGAANTADGQAITWGVRDDTSAPWGTTCVTADCSVVLWGDVTSENVVWGWTCGGTDCNVAGQPLPLWSVSSCNTESVAWGTSDEGDTVVWGTADDGDTVVWGTSDDGDTVVWGTSEDGDVIWDTSCEGPDFTAVN